MNRNRNRVLAPALVLLLGACATTATERRGGAADPNLITTAELQAAGHVDAWGVVQALRPHWLRHRGPTTITGRETIKVYLDGLLLGGPDQLQQITTSSIASLRFLDAHEATQRWGLDHGQGAIVVSTRP
jgi:hypothetical protein